jgi:hypothetical protein
MKHHYWYIMRAFHKKNKFSNKIKSKLDLIFLSAIKMNGNEWHFFYNNKFNYISSFSLFFVVDVVIKKTSRRMTFFNFNFFIKKLYKFSR